jgi:hypothetical protein
MKLRRSERSYEQRRADQSVGLNPWRPDEFAFSADLSEIAIPCARGTYDRCVIRITTGEPQHPVWKWDGNLDEPTLTPSIGCDHRCGWHGQLTRGILNP